MRLPECLAAVGVSDDAEMQLRFVRHQTAGTRCAAGRSLTRKKKVFGYTIDVDGDWVVIYCLCSMLAPKSRHTGPIWPHTVHSAVTGSRRVRGVGQRSTKPIAVTNHGFVGCPTGGGAELTKATTLGSCDKRSKHGQRRSQHMELVWFVARKRDMAYQFGGLFSLLIHFSEALSGTSIASGAWGTCMKHVFEGRPRVYIVHDVEGACPPPPHPTGPWPPCSLCLHARQVVTDKVAEHDRPGRHTPIRRAGVRSTPVGGSDWRASLAVLGVSGS